MAADQLGSDPGRRGFMHKDEVEEDVRERSITLWEGIKTYPKAIGWSVVLSTAIVMEGYDVALVSAMYAMTAFNRRFGNLQPDGSYVVSPAWQSGLVLSMNVGQIVGLLVTGIVADKYGYKKTMSVALVATIGCIFIFFFAGSVQLLLVAQLLIGIPMGAFQTMTGTYAAEVVPTVLRPYVTTYVNACWGIGQLLAAGVLREMFSRDDEWAYRLPFAIQWVWPVPILIGALLAPESPWWLVRHGLPEAAKHSLHRLRKSKDAEVQTLKELAMMQLTDKQEKEHQSGTTYLDCLRGSDLRRTEICCITAACQSLCGSGLIGYSTYFYKTAGLTETGAFSLSIAQSGVGLVGTFISWVLMSYLGRRTLYFGGLLILDLLLLSIGLLSLAPSTTIRAWATGSMLLAYAFFYNSTVGPVCYSLVNELPSTRLRQKTVVLSRISYNICSIFNSIAIPYMLNETAWNWANKTGLFWAGICSLCVVYIWFRLPEPKGRTYAELDTMFEQRLKARRFEKYNTTEKPSANEMLQRTKEAKEPRKADKNANVDHQRAVSATSFP